MKAFIFPGQGSQTVGMGKTLAAAFPVARAVFDEVDDTLNRKLSTLMFEGPAEELNLTTNTQPAVLANSIALLRVLKLEGGIPVQVAGLVAGHSLGEFTALTAAEFMTLRDVTDLLDSRGDAMQSLVPVGQGAMAALLKVTYEEAEQIAALAANESEVCEVVNDNAPGQLVISGHKTAILRAITIADGMDKRARLLPVSVPAHTSLMRPASDLLFEKIGQLNLKVPVVPVISNVTAELVDDPALVRVLLSKQVRSKVRWRESVQTMKRLGVTETIELGSNTVSSFVRRTEESIVTTHIVTSDDVEAFIGNHEHLRLTPSAVAREIIGATADLADFVP